MSQTYYQLKAHQRYQIEAYLTSGKRKSFIAEALRRFNHQVQKLSGI